MDDFKIGDRITYYLNVKGLSQKDFAKLCNIKEVTLSRYITGEREPKFTTVMTMAWFLGVSVDELVDMDKYLERKYCEEIKQSITQSLPYKSKKIPQ